MDLKQNSSNGMLCLHDEILIERGSSLIQLEVPVATKMSVVYQPV